jgi:hypothetical protein
MVGHFGKSAQFKLRLCMVGRCRELVVAVTFWEWKRGGWEWCCEVEAVVGELWLS